jgi:hypothetical protein
MHGESLEVRDITSLTMRPVTFLTVPSESVRYSYGAAFVRLITSRLHSFVHTTRAEW